MILLGHSYGGLLVVAFAKAWDMDVPLQIHSIAAPLKEWVYSLLSAIMRCPIFRITLNSINGGLSKELDGAFSDLDYDPQRSKKFPKARSQDFQKHTKEIN